MNRLALLAVVACFPAAAAVAIAAIPRPAPISPKGGAVLSAGKTPTFKFRSSGAGSHWVHVSRSARRGADGVIKHDASIGRARRVRGTTATWVQKPRFYDYPAFWANQARTYYWQAFRIACGEEDSSNDCRVEGPVRRFRLR